MLPDWEFPETSEGFKLIGVKHPKAGHYMVGSDGKAFRIAKAREKYFIEHHPVFRKIKKSEKKK